MALAENFGIAEKLFDRLEFALASRKGLGSGRGTYCAGGGGGRHSKWPPPPPSRPSVARPEALPTSSSKTFS